MVDELRVWPHARHRCFMCGSAHLTTDGPLAELHAFAARIGLRRAWFQDRSTPHYDLSPGKRELALDAGAVFVEARVQARRRLEERGAIMRGMDKPLRKRSELKKTKDPEKEKPSAVERTVPIPGTVSPTGFQCSQCKAASEIAKCSKRANGDLECEHCGMPHDEADVKAGGVGGVSEPKTAGPPQADQPKAYCDQCGANWPRLEVSQWKPFPNCGHTNGYVDDPRKAKEWKPPPGHPRPDPPPEVAMMKREPAIAGTQSYYSVGGGGGGAGEPNYGAGAAGGGGSAPTAQGQVRSTQLPNGLVNLHVEWGKVTIQRGHYSTVGPFAIHVDCRREDALAVGIETLDLLEKLADHAMKKQRAWYLRKLEQIQKEEGG
jgi:hypothetical protein